MPKKHSKETGIKMKLPDNFWEEFDKRLDQKLDEKLNHRFNEFENRINARFTTLEETVRNIKNWTERQDLCIEDEISMSAFNHIESKNYGYFCIRPVIMSKKLIDRNKDTITDFDGIVVLTNNMVLKKKLLKVPITEEDLRPVVQKPGQLPFPKPKSYFIVVESKQHLTTQKVKAKINQVKAITELLENLHTPENRLNQHDKDIFQHFEKEVGLYVGGQAIDKQAKILMKTFIESKTQDSYLYGLVTMNGVRFSVENADNNFGDFNFAFGGAAHKKQRAPVKKQ